MAYTNVSSIEEFEKEVISSTQTVVVDFWAPWCGPCKMFANTFGAVSDELSEVKFVKVNVDEAGELAQKFDIMGIPALLIFKNGEVVAEKSGAMEKQMFVEWINSN